MVTTEVQEQKAPTKRWSLDPARTSVDFAVGTFWGLATVRGHFDRFAGTYESGPAGAKMELTIEADSLDTGNTGRDEHLRSYDFFDVVPNPHVHFTSTQVADAADGTLRITGMPRSRGQDRAGHTRGDGAAGWRRARARGEHERRPARVRYEQRPARDDPAPGDRPCESATYLSERAAQARPVREPEVGRRRRCARRRSRPGTTESGSTSSSSHPEQRLAELAAEAVADGADALGVAGGDGSLAIVAAAACEHGLPFVCVPMGTRNHFALDLGLNRNDVLGALDALTEGVERRIDVAEVNGRLFLNNVSLGIYGDAVRQAAYRDAKVRTLLQTAEKVVGPNAEVHDLQLVDDGGRVHRRPAIVLVSNNPYALDPPFPHGTRPTLDSGRLGVIVLDTPQPGRPPGRAWTTTVLEVTGPTPVHAGIDGEACDLDLPLRFTIRPRALRVRVSARL